MTFGVFIFDHTVVVFPGGVGLQTIDFANGERGLIRESIRKDHAMAEASIVVRPPQHPLDLSQ
jgi:hypothetical protein